MAHIKRGTTSKARHKKLLKKAKGYYGARSRTYRSANQAVIKSGQYSYRDRRQKKRQFRKLWIIRINAAARKNNISYNTFMFKLKQQNISINRKILSDIAIYNPVAFDSLISQVNDIKNTSVQKNN